MSNQINDTISEQKIEAYKEYLQKLDEEFFGYEFNDRMGCNPSEYFTNEINAERRDVQEETLVDRFASVLMNDLDAEFIQEKYREACLPKKKYRASIYVEIKATSENKAYEIARLIAVYLGNPEDNELPEGYCNPFVGGAGQVIDGDLLGNAKRLEHI